MSEQASPWRGPASTSSHQVLMTLLDNGRWNDAARYCSTSPGRVAAMHAELLLATGRVAEAAAVLTGQADPAASMGPRLAFLTSARAVLDREPARFPDLVALAATPEVQANPLTHLIMMRAAQRVGRPQIAAHYAALLRSTVPGDLEACTAVVVDLVGRGSYLDAVRVVDRAEAWHCEDEPHPLEQSLQALEATGHASRAAALAVVGDYLHREADPTLPVSALERTARLRWRRARRQRTPRVPIDRVAWLALVCAVAGVSLAMIGTAWPATVCGVVAAGWLRRRPVPGVDPASSRLVRALADPLVRLRNRRYHAADVLTFILTYGAAISLASVVPADPDLMAGVGLMGGLVVALSAVRARRRWVRRQRTRWQRPVLDPAECRCLDLDRLHQDTAGPYVDLHLFPVDDVPDLPGWRLVQCLETFRIFMACPAAGLTVALTPVHERGA